MFSQKNYNDNIVNFTNNSQIVSNNLELSKLAIGLSVDLVNGMQANPSMQYFKNVEDLMFAVSNTYSKILHILESDKSNSKIPLYQKMNINLNDIVKDEYVVCLESGKKMKTLKSQITSEKYKR